MNRDQPKEKAAAPLEDWIAAAARQAESARRGAAALPTRRPGVDGNGWRGGGRLGQPEIPGYQVLGERARGGQGIVYEAIQTGTNRRVAIKVLRGASNDDDSAVRARFEREVELLAQLRHPNIVAIHESSATAADCFCVMEFVDGQPLDRWLSQRAVAGSTDGAGRWTLEDTLRLFVKIADAVQAAHVRGVIHRDLKPGNVLVDAAGEPRVLDFGLAKLRSADDLSQADGMTQTGQFVGSLPWSSPEQLEGRHADIDTRSDVYSLGVMLYHALTGQMPHPLGGALPDFVRSLREVEPRDPKALNRAIDDELATIVLQCLQKDPERRYQTAGELTADLRHYLANEPVSAKRNSQVYLLRKMLHRHRWPVRGALAIGVGLLGSTALLAKMYVDSVRARDQAHAAREAAEIARETALAANRKADQRASQSEAAMAFLREGVLGAVDPARVSGPVTLEAMLADATALIDDGALKSQPIVEASVREALGDAFVNLAQYAAAETQFNAALALRRADGDDETSDCSAAMTGLGQVYESRGDYDGAIRQFSQALELARAARDDQRIAVALNNIGTMYRSKADFARAEEYLRAALAACPTDSPQGFNRATALTDLGSTLFFRNQIDAAKEMFEQSIALDRAAGPRREFGLAATLASLGGYLTDFAPDYERARELLMESREIYLRRVGPEHRYTLTTDQNLAATLVRLGQRAEAEELLRHCVEVRRRKYGTADVETRGAIYTLGWMLGEIGRVREAIPLVEESVQLGEQLLGRDHPRVQSSVATLAYLMLRDQRWADAAALFCEQYTREARDQPGSLVLAQTAGLFGRVFIEAGDLQAGECLIRECLETRQALLPPDDPNVISAQFMLADALMRAGRREEARAIAAEASPLADRNTKVPPGARDALCRILIGP